MNMLEANAAPHRLPETIDDFNQAASVALGPHAGPIAMLLVASLALLAVLVVLAAWGRSSDPCLEAESATEPPETIDPARRLTFREAISVAVGIAIAASLLIVWNLWV